MKTSVHGTRRQPRNVTERTIAVVLAVALPACSSHRSPPPGAMPPSDTSVGILAVGEFGDTGWLANNNGPTGLNWFSDMVVPSGAWGSLPGAGTVTDTGLFAYTVPLEVPAGRRGMAPTLSLAYTSTQTNDLLGVGWGLSGLSAISPCMKRHATDQTAYKGAWCLDGTRLVEGPNADEFRTEEESYSRITRSGTQFTVETKSGQVRVYERDLAGTKLASALLISATDRNGNEIRYHYDVVDAGEYYPKEITYTHKGDEPARRKVTFEYDTRADVVEAYALGAHYETTRLLTAIAAHAPNPNQTQEVWRYEFSYSTSAASNRPLLKEIVRRDQLGGRTLARIFNWTSTNGPQYDTVVASIGITETALDSGYLIADFDQDGRDDILYQPTTNAPVLRHTVDGGSLLGAEDELHGLKRVAHGTTKYPDLSRARVADLNGDGYPDITAPTAVYSSELAPDHTPWGWIRQWIVYRWDPVARDFVNEPDYISHPEWAVLADEWPPWQYDGTLEMTDTAFPLDLADLDGDGVADAVAGLTPYVGAPILGNHLYWRWEVALGKPGGGFEMPMEVLMGSDHAYQAPDPYQVSLGNGRVSLLGMSTKAQGCQVEAELHDYCTHLSCRNECPDSYDSLECESNASLPPHAIFDPDYPSTTGSNWPNWEHDIHDTALEPCFYQYCPSSYPQYKPERWESGKTDVGVSLDEAGNPIVVSFDQALGDQTIRATADMNGDHNDDVVTFHTDTNHLCVRAWGDGEAFKWLNTPTCVYVPSVWPVDPAIWKAADPTDPCSFKELATPAPWTVRVWDVDGNGRHDVVIEHTDGADKVIESFRVHLDSSNTLLADQLALPYVNSLGTWPTASSERLVGDFDGDGDIDVLVFDDGQAVIQRAMGSTADLITGVTDEHATHELEQVEYSTDLGIVESTWKNGASPYIGDDGTPDPDLPTPYPVRPLRRAIQVVREHRVYQGDDIGTYLHHEYAYADPTYDVRGRGFLGFRVVDHYIPDVPTETVTFFDNHTHTYDLGTNQGGIYPGALRPIEVVQVTPILPTSTSPCDPCDARVVHYKQAYKTSPGMASKSFVVQPSEWEVREWEGVVSKVEIDGHVPHLTTAGSLVPRPLYATSEVKYSYGDIEFDAFGNVTSDKTWTTCGVTTPCELSIARETLYYPADLGNWRLDLVQLETVTRGENGQLGVPRSVLVEHDSNGLPWRLHRQPAGAPEAQSTVTLTRNGDGSVIKVVESANAATDRVLDIEYDPIERMYVNQVTNGLGHVTRTLTHPAYSVVVASLDPNNVLSWRQINDRGLTVRSQRHGSAAENLAYFDRASNGVRVERWSDADSAMSVMETDVRGRPIWTMRTHFDGTNVFAENVYDHLGRRVKWSLPASSLPGASYGEIVFDTLGRPTTAHAPGMAATTFTHTFLTTTELRPSDANSPPQKTMVWRDLAGRVIRNQQYELETASWLLTHFSYSPSGDLAEITDPEGNVTKLGHDELGRQILVEDPDAGTTAVVYNGLGDVVSTSRDGAMSIFVRDGLGRVLEESNDDGVTTFVWDTKLNGVGRLDHSVGFDGVVHDLTYDAYGRVELESWSVDGTTYTFQNHYDQHGRPSGLTYPHAGGTSFTTNVHYNAFGYPDVVHGIDPVTNQPVNFWTSTGFSPVGGLTHGVYGNGVTAWRQYDWQTGQLEFKFDGAIASHYFEYDAAGRLESDTDGTGRVETYAYDSLGRLKSWAVDAPGGAGQRTVEYTYDQLGNLLSEKIEGGVAGIETITHATAMEPERPHVPLGEDYDGRGRRKGHRGFLVEYTEFDLPKQIGGEARFTYDAEHQRVKKLVFGATTVTLKGLYEHRFDAQGVSEVFMVPGAEGLVAQVVVNPTPGASHVEYLHNVRKGTVSAVSGAAGVAQSALYFDPFGQRTDVFGEVVASASGDVNLGFNGLNHDNELGLIDQRGRIYDPATRRFMTPDPIISSLANSQTFNPYSYVYNDPVNLIDPSGFEGIPDSLPDTNPMLTHVIGAGYALANLWDAVSQAINNPTPNGCPTCTTPTATTVKVINCPPPAAAVTSDGRSTVTPAAVSATDDFPTLGFRVAGPGEVRTLPSWKSEGGPSGAELFRALRGSLPFLRTPIEWVKDYLPDGAKQDTFVGVDVISGGGGLYTGAFAITNMHEYLAGTNTEPPYFEVLAGGSVSWVELVSTYFFGGLHSPIDLNMGRFGGIKVYANSVDAPTSVKTAWVEMRTVQVQGELGGAELEAGRWKDTVSEKGGHDHEGAGWYAGGGFKVWGYGVTGFFGR